MLVCVYIYIYTYTYIGTWYDEGHARQTAESMWGRVLLLAEGLSRRVDSAESFLDEHVQEKGKERQLNTCYVCGHDREVGAVKQNVALQKEAGGSYQPSSGASE